MRRKRRLIGLALPLALVWGCAPSTDPGVLATPLPGVIARTAGENAGVRLDIRPDIQHPGELDHAAVPLYVVVTNDSGRNLIVQPNAFALVAPDGGRQTAIQPDVLRRSTETSIGTDIAVSLRALPTDALGDGAQTRGFLYFPVQRTASPIALRFELRAQHDDAQFGLIAIPLTHWAEAE